MTISLPNQSSAANASWNVTPPAGVTIDGLSAARSVSGVGPGSNMSYALAGTDDACGPTTACSAADYSWSGSAAKLQFSLSCSNCQSSDPDGASLTISWAVLKLGDPTPPTFSSPPAGGAFDASGPIAGTQTTNFTAHDDGGGVYTAAFVVDGVEQARQAVDDNGGACREPFVKQVPCKADASGSLAWDTTTVADGAHTVALNVYDTTGVNGVAYGPVDVTVKNTPDPPTAGSTAHIANGTNASSRAKFVPVARLSKGTVRQRFGKRTVVTGHLVDEIGRPIAGARLAVFVTPRRPGGLTKLIAGPVTGAKGAYRFVVGPGANRKVAVAYRADATSPSFSTSWTLRIDVPAPIRLTPSSRHLRNGEVLRLVARVGAGHVPARSADVAYQVLIAGHWRTFASRLLDRRGRTSIAHRFHVTFRRTRYAFRAVVHPRGAFPYAAAHSKPVGVLVN
jgi:hypothetical protein